MSKRAASSKNLPASKKQKIDNTPSRVTRSKAKLEQVTQSIGDSFEDSLSDSGSDSGGELPVHEEQPLKGADLIGKLVKVWYRDPKPDYYLGVVIKYNKGTGAYTIQFKDGNFERYLDSDRSWYMVKDEIGISFNVPKDDTDNDKSSTKNVNTTEDTHDKKVTSTTNTDTEKETSTNQVSTTDTSSTEYKPSETDDKK
eukprot:TRINITY_DN1257_c0_g1_i5.p2 TRINITY_DN1257_c0_g1~~TRINITY_DN1257_c0_g1_i5.p2  ORF type:complete len:198 (-),score=32.74 TRINITY_DN1257_c0_g1_i5:13-606(-)